MKRVIGLLAAGVLTLAVAVNVPSQPAMATAAIDVCAGSGVLNTGSRLFYPGLGPDKASSFAASLTTGTCGSGGALGVAGDIRGNCVIAVVDGMTNNGRSFGATVVGSLWVVAGGAVGVLVMVPDATTGHSCASTGASRFLISGAVVFV